MAILAWGPLHAENWQQHKEGIVEELWLKRARLAALCRGLLAPESTEEAEEMLGGEGAVPWLCHHNESVGTDDKFAASAGKAVGRCEELDEDLPCWVCAMVQKEKEKAAKSTRRRGKDTEKAAPEMDSMVECEMHEIMYNANADCPCASRRETRRRGG